MGALNVLCPSSDSEDNEYNDMMNKSKDRVEILFHEENIDYELMEELFQQFNEKFKNVQKSKNLKFSPLQATNSLVNYCRYYRCVVDDSESYVTEYNSEIIFGSKEVFEVFSTNVEVLEKLSINNKFILPLKGISKSPKNHVGLSFEYKDTVEWRLTKNSLFQPLRLRVKLRILQEVVSGLICLNQNQISHQDLSWSSVALVGAKDNARIIGCGIQMKTYLAFISNKNIFSDTEIEEKLEEIFDPLKNEKLRYLDPEIISSRTFPKSLEELGKSDVYSFAIMMFELISGKMYNLDSSKFLKNLKIRPDIRKLSYFKYSQLDWFFKLMTSCFHPNREDRPSFKEIHIIMDEMLQEKLEEICELDELDELDELGHNSSFSKIQNPMKESAENGNHERQSFYGNSCDWEEENEELEDIR